MSICDLLIIFSDQLATNENVGVQKLEYRPSVEQQLILNDFVQQIVFAPQQEGKNLHRKNS